MLCIIEHRPEANISVFTEKTYSNSNFEKMINVMLPYIRRINLTKHIFLPISSFFPKYLTYPQP